MKTRFASLTTWGLWAAGRGIGRLIIYSGPPKGISKTKDSLTAAYPSGRKQIEVLPNGRNGAIVFAGARNNRKMSR